MTKTMTKSIPAQEAALAEADRELEMLRTQGKGGEFHRRRRQKEREHVRALGQRNAPAGPPQSVLDKMAAARKSRMKAEVLRASNPKKNAKAIKEHEADAIRAEREAAQLQAEAAGSDWASRANQETEDLARARGEPVEACQDGKRIMSRNGIRQAYEDGHMKPAHGPLKERDLYATALAYNRAVVAMLPGSGGETEGGGGFTAKGPQVRVVEAGEALATMRNDLSKRQIDVLDHVCGMDMRLRETATVLRRGFPSTRNSLISGLELATLNLRAARAVKKVDPDKPTTKERLQAAAAQIDQAMRSA